MFNDHLSNKLSQGENGGGKLRFLSGAVVIILFMFSSLLTSQAGQEPKTLSRLADPVIVTGDNLEDFIGHRLDRLRLYASHENDFLIIPFQFDEYSEQGRKVFPNGPERNPEEGNGLLDERDEFIFMAMDTGDRIETDHLLINGLEKILEIVVTDPVNKKKGWCYLVAFSCEPPPCSSVSYTGVIDPNGPTGYSAATDFFYLKGKTISSGKKTYKQVFYEEVRTPTTGGGTNRDYVDRMMWRVDIKLMFSLLSIKLDEDEMSGDFIAWNQGPVRGTLRVGARVKLSLGLKSPRFIADVVEYRTMCSTVTELSVPFNPGVVISKLVTRIGTDMSYEAFGMMFYNSENPDGFLIDGRTSEQEKGVKTDIDTWRLVTGPQGSLMNRSFWSKDFLKQIHDNRISYHDDLEKPIPPESEPGQIGHVSSVSEVKSLKAGKYFIGIEWYWPPFFYGSGKAGSLNREIIQQYLNYQDRPLTYQISGKQGVSRTQPRPPKK